MDAKSSRKKNNKHNTKKNQQVEAKMTPKKAK